MNTKIQKYTCVISPGYIAINDKPSFFCSVCGSGVVVTVWDRVKRNGGIVHCVFPRRRRMERSTNYHADIAIPRLISQLLLYKSQLRDLEAQVFGGGNPAFFPRTQSLRLIKATRRELNRFRINIVSEDLGGNIGRKVIFDTYSGDVMVLKTKSIRKSDWAPSYGIKTYDR